MFWSLYAQALAEFDWLILTPEGPFLKLFQQYLLQQNSTNLINIYINPTNVLCRVCCGVYEYVCGICVCVCVVCVYL